MTERPARVLNLPAGGLEEGAEADFVLLDPEREWTVQPADLPARAAATPPTWARP